MARRDRSAADRDTQAADRHTPSSPSRPPVVTIYCSRQDREDKVLIVSWATWQSAAGFLEAIIEDQEGEAKWLKHKLGRWTQLVWPSGLTVTTRDDKTLEKLAEADSGDFTLEEPYLGMIRQFLSDSEPVANDYERRPKERGEKSERKPREPREKRAKKSDNRPAGFVHVSELVPDVSPPHARQALRSLKWEKPDYGWWFDPSRAKEVSKAIKGALK